MDIRSLTPGEFRSLLNELKVPVNIMLPLAGCLGPRISVVLPLKWDDINEKNCSFPIRRSFTRWQFDEVKTAASKATLPVDKVLLPILKA